MSYPCPVCFFKHMFTDCLFYVIQHCTATLHFVSASLHWFHRNHIHNHPNTMFSYGTESLLSPNHRF